MGDTEKALPWDATPSPAWGREVDGWSWEALGGGDWAKSGPCPRCHHEITVTKEGSVASMVEVTTEELDLLVQAEEGPLVSEAEDNPQFFARCDCGEAHSGRPPQLTGGCGQSAFIDPPPG
jgi:hypothetical protein